MEEQFYTREYDTPPAPSREGKGYFRTLLSGVGQVVSGGSISLPSGEGAGGVLSFLFLTALFLFTQPVFSQTGNILFTPESLTVLDDSVRIRMTITVRNIELPTERSLSLTPSLRKGSKQVSLPPVILSGRQRSRFDRREELIAPSACKEEPYIRLVDIKENKTYTIHYYVSIPYAGWMCHAALCLKQAGKDCCEETLLSETILTKDIQLPDPCTGLKEKGGEP